MTCPNYRRQSCVWCVCTEYPCTAPNRFLMRTRSSYIVAPRALPAHWRAGDRCAHGRRERALGSRKRLPALRPWRKRPLGASSRPLDSTPDDKHFLSPPASLCRYRSAFLPSRVSTFEVHALALNAFSLVRRFCGGLCREEVLEVSLELGIVPCELHGRRGGGRGVGSSSAHCRTVSRRQQHSQTHLRL